MRTRQSASSCPSCSKQLNDDVLKCHLCHVSFHPACVGASSDHPPINWSCITCEIAATRNSMTSRSPTQQLPQGLDNMRFMSPLDDLNRSIRPEVDGQHQEENVLDNASAITNSSESVIQHPIGTQSQPADPSTIETLRAPPIDMSPFNWPLHTNINFQSAATGFPQTGCEFPPTFGSNVFGSFNTVNQVARLEKQLLDSNRRAAEKDKEIRELRNMVNNSRPSGIPSPATLRRQLSPSKSDMNRQNTHPTSTLSSVRPNDTSAANQAPQVQQLDIAAVTAQVINQLANMGVLMQPPAHPKLQAKSANCVREAPEHIAQLNAELAYSLRKAETTYDGRSADQYPAYDQRGFAETVNDGTEPPLTNVDPMSQLTALMGRKSLSKLPEFSGDEKKWAYFQSVFNRTTIEGRYTEADNVARLREALKGSAHTLVQSQLMYSSNASEIMEVLRKFYGRTDIVIYAHMQDLLNFNQIISEDDPKLRNFAVAVQEYVSIIKSLRQESELSNKFQLVSLSGKLHYGQYKDWKKLLDAYPELTLEDFAIFLMRKVQEIPPDRFKNLDDDRSKASDEAQKPKRVSSHSRPSEESPPRRKSLHRSCLLCNGEHGLWRCKSFLNKETRDRYRYVMDNDICCCCLASKNHQWRECENLRKCNVDGCKKNHHHTLHSVSNSRTRTQGHSQTAESGNHVIAAHWRESYSPPPEDYRQDQVSQPRPNRSNQEGQLSQVAQFSGQVQPRYQH